MEECNMYNCGSERCKANTISQCKENAEVKWSFFLIGRNVQMEIGINDGSDIVFLAVGFEKFVGIYWEGSGFVDVEPIKQGC